MAHALADKFSPDLTPSNSFFASNDNGAMGHAGFFGPEEEETNPPCDVYYGRGAMNGESTSWWTRMANAAQSTAAFVTHFPVGFLNGAWEYVGTKARELWGDIKAMFTGEFVQSIWAMIKAVVTDPFSLVRSLFEGIRDELQSAFCHVENLWNVFNDYRSRGDHSNMWLYIGELVGFVLACVVLEFSGVGPRIAARIGGTFMNLARRIGAAAKRKGLALPGGGIMRFDDLDDWFDDLDRRGGGGFRFERKSISNDKIDELSYEVAFDGDMVVIKDVELTRGNMFSVAQVFKDEVGEVGSFRIKFDSDNAVWQSPDFEAILKRFDPTVNIMHNGIETIIYRD